MDDLKKLTVRYLRALARKRIGEGHIKLKTKAELLNALKDWLHDVLEAKRPHLLEAKRPPPVQTGVTAGKAAAKVSSARGGKAAAKVSTSARVPRRAPPGKRGGSKSGSRTSKAVGQLRTEPLIEGFFVARAAEATEAPTSSSPPPASGEGVADLPEQEGDLRMHALARDPATLFAFWDFPKASWQRAARGLRSPRAVLRIFQGSLLVREHEVAAESRGFYVHYLSPGQRYRVEAHLKDVDGRSRRVGHPSDIVELPKSSPSGDEARFARLAWGSDLRSIHTGHARVIDEQSAQRLAAAFGAHPSAAPFGGTSERRDWLFSPSGAARR